MSKKKKFIPNIKTEYSSKELKKSLKYYDKSLGVKLNSKKSDIKKDSKKRKSLEIGIHNALIGVNCIISGVPIKTTKINNKKKIKKVKGFTEASNLDFGIKRYSTDDIMFRKKFVALTTARILKNEKKILNKISKPYKGRRSYEKFRMVKDHELFDSYMSFVISMIRKNPDVNYNLFDMYFITSNKDITKSLTKTYDKVYKDVSKNYDKIFGEKSSKTLSDVFNLAIILSTGNDKLSIYRNKNFRSVTSDDDLGMAIEKLGRKIIKNGISPMFKIYLQCNPKVTTMYIKEVRESDAMMVGLLALSFEDFMMQNKTLHSVIRNLLRRPWTNPEK